MALPFLGGLLSALPPLKLHVGGFILNQVPEILACFRALSSLLRIDHLWGPVATSPYSRWLCGKYLLAPPTLK